MRPREKMERFGPSSLSDEELIMVMLGSGTKQTPVKKLATQVIRLIDTGNTEIDLLKKIDGLGSAKSCLLKAADEFYRRRIRPSGVKIRRPDDIYPAIMHFAARRQEYFLTVTLNGASEIINTHVITIGLANRSQIHPREVFIKAIEDCACSVILAHNHPSGSLEPSNEDIKTTGRLVKAGNIIGIQVLDHIIISTRGFLSLTSKGLLSEA